jgi:phosphoenolpyruvate synthase/pyruvate phosphate dikinase
MVELQSMPAVFQEETDHLMVKTFRMAQDIVTVVRAEAIERLLYRELARSGLVGCDHYTAVAVFGGHEIIVLVDHAKRFLQADSRGLFIQFRQKIFQLYMHVGVSSVGKLAVRNRNTLCGSI